MKTRGMLGRTLFFCVNLLIQLLLPVECNPLCNIQNNFEEFSNKCGELLAVKQFLHFQNSSGMVSSSACVGGGFGNQMNGIKANLVLSLATQVPFVKIKSGYDYNLYFKLFRSPKETIVTSSPCPPGARRINMKKLGAGKGLPRKIEFSGRPEYLGFLESSKLKLSEYELKCLVRTVMEISDLFTAKMTEFIRSTLLKSICSGELSSLVSIHIRIGDSELITKSMVKKYGLKSYYSTHTVFSVEDVEKVFQFAVSIYPDSTKTLFFLATDSSRVKRKFKDFFKGMTHMTQERKIRHTHLQTHSSLLMNAIDIALLSYGDSLVYTGSSFAEAAHMLQLNPGQKKFKFS